MMSTRVLNNDSQSMCAEEESRYGVGGIKLRDVLSNVIKVWQQPNPPRPTTEESGER